MPLGDEEEEEKEGEGEKRELCSTKNARRIEQSEAKGKRKVVAPEVHLPHRHEAMSHAFPAQPESPDDNRQNQLLPGCFRSATHTPSLAYPLFFCMSKNKSYPYTQ